MEATLAKIYVMRRITENQPGDRWKIDLAGLLVTAAMCFLWLFFWSEPVKRNLGEDVPAVIGILVIAWYIWASRFASKIDAGKYKWETRIALSLGALLAKGAAYLVWQ